MQSTPTWSWRQSEGRNRTMRPSYTGAKKMRNSCHKGPWFIKIGLDRIRTQGRRYCEMKEIARVRTRVAGSSSKERTHDTNMLWTKSPKRLRYADSFDGDACVAPGCSLATSPLLFAEPRDRRPFAWTSTADDVPDTSCSSAWLPCE